MVSSNRHRDATAYVHGQTSLRGEPELSLRHGGT